jgi:hypothetical protein
MRGRQCQRPGRFDFSLRPANGAVHGLSIALTACHALGRGATHWLPAGSMRCKALCAYPRNAMNQRFDCLGVEAPPIVAPAGSNFLYLALPDLLRHYPAREYRPNGPGARFLSAIARPWAACRWEKSWGKRIRAVRADLAQILLWHAGHSLALKTSALGKAALASSSQVQMVLPRVAHENELSGH